MSDLSAQTRWLDATGQAELVRSGHATALELLEAAIERIEAADPGINAVVMRWFDQARRTAAGALPDRGVPGRPVPAEGLDSGLCRAAAGQRQPAAEGGGTAGAC